MELSTAIRSRRSIRSYQSRPIPEDVLRELVELANWAPSAGNLQARDFIVVRDQATRQALAHAADQEELARASVVVAICTNATRIAKYGVRGRELFSIQDAAAATENLLLAAHERGLGAVWMGSFDEGDVRRILGIPRDARPVTLIALGWPAEEPRPPERLPVGQVLHWERW